MKKKLLYTLLLILMVLGCTTNQNLVIKDDTNKVFSPDDFHQRIDEFLGNKVRKTGIHGLSAVIVIDGEPFLIGSYGKRNIAEKLTVTEETIFPIGSVAKTFTAIALMQMVEEGLVDLDMPISSYLPDLNIENSYEDIITPRMLMTHHSGIHGDIHADWILEQGSEEPMRELPMHLEEAGVILEPETMFSYCNSGYTLIALIIESVSGLSYSEYIRGQVFEPAGIENALIYPGERSNENYTLGYNGKKAVEIPAIRDIAAGGIACSANDMAGYLIQILRTYNEDTGLLQRSTYRSMLQRQNADMELDRDHSMGLTWWLTNPFHIPGIVASHGGDLPPYNAFLTTVPEEGIGIFIANNTGGKESMQAILIGIELLEAVYEWHTGIELPEPEAPELISVQSSELLQYEGYYASITGISEVNLQGKSLTMTFAGMKLYLETLSDGTFAPEFRLFGFIPIPIPELEMLTVDFFTCEDATYLHIVMGGYMHMICEEIRLYDLPEVYESYTGTYTISEGQSEIEVDQISIGMNEKSGFMEFSCNWFGQKQVFALRPVSENLAVTAGMGRGMGEKLRFEQISGDIILHWSGLTLRKE